MIPAASSSPLRSPLRPEGGTGAPTGSVDELPRPSGARCGAGAPLPSGAAGGSGAEAEAGEVGSDPWPGGQPSPGPPSLPHPPRGHPCQHSHRRGRCLGAGSQPPSPCTSPRDPSFPSPPSPVPGSKRQKMAWPDRRELRHVFSCLTSGFVIVCLKEHELLGGGETPIFTLDPTHCHQHLWGERVLVSPSASPQQPCRSSAALMPFLLEQDKGH